jgi:hypothetical protein
MGVRGVNMWSSPGVSKVQKLSWPPGNNITSCNDATGLSLPETKSEKTGKKHQAFPKLLEVFDRCQQVEVREKFG